MKSKDIVLRGLALAALCLVSLVVTIIFAFSGLHARRDFIWWGTGMYVPLRVIRYHMARVSQEEKERKVQHMISGYGRRVLMPVLVLALANIGVEVIPFRYTWAVVSLFVLPLIALHAYGGYCSLQTLKSSNSSS